MKKTLFAFVMSAILVAMASCGGNGHTKAFNESKKLYDKITESIKTAKTCDDVDMAAFGMLGLLGIEGLDALTADEQKELETLGEQMEKVMADKKAELGCKDDFWGSDEEEEVPSDEPAEEEAE